MDQLFHAVREIEGYALTVDLQEQTLTMPNGERFTFEVDAFRKHCLLNGLDEIGLTLQHAEKIKQFELRRREEQPWLFST